MTTQATDFRVTVEPVVATPAMEFGPSDSVAANAVLLTKEYLRQIGSYPPRVGHDWQCNLTVYQTIDGVETVVDIRNWTLTGTYWDWIKQTAIDLPVAVGSGDGQIVITLPDAPTTAAVAGMYNFSITAEQDPTKFDVCSGKLEILPATPS